MSLLDLFAAPPELDANDPLVKVEQQLLATAATPGADLRAKILAAARAKSEAPRGSIAPAPSPIAPARAQLAPALAGTPITRRSIRSHPFAAPKRAPNRFTAAAMIAAAALLLLNFARSVSFRERGDGGAVSPLLCAQLADQPNPLLAEVNPSLQRACDGPER
jgi:hypothetical protein